MMRENKTAKEIATEYEKMAIESANQYCRLKDQNPFEDFSALAKHVAFCTTMQRCWVGIANKIGIDQGAYDQEDYYGEYGI